MFNLKKNEYQICNLFSELKINVTEVSQAQHIREFKTIQNMFMRLLMQSINLFHIAELYSDVNRVR